MGVVATDNRTGPFDTGMSNARTVLAIASGRTIAGLSAVCRTIVFSSFIDGRRAGLDRDRG